MEKIELAKKMAPHVKFIEIADYECGESEMNYNIEETDPACIVLTGGTTGKSNGSCKDTKESF